MISKILNLLKKLNIIKPILTFINNFGIHKKLFKGSQMRAILNVLQSGDIILTRPALETTNSLFGKEEFTHAIIKGDDIYIVDATSAGVTVRDVLETFVGTKKVCVLRPKLNPTQITASVQRAYYYSTLGLEYDYGFSTTKEEMYCSELVMHCLNDVVPNMLELRPRFGEKTITPQDLYLAQSKFDKVIELEVENK